MDESRGARPEQVWVEKWELELLRKVGSAFRTPNRDDLIAELGRKFLELKCKRPRHVLDWRAYLAKFFYNKAHNFVQDERSRAKRLASGADDVPANVAPDSRESQFDPADLEKDLAPADRQLLACLMELNGNQSLAARRLGLHRNTVRLRLAKIRAVLSSHGY